VPLFRRSRTWVIDFHFDGRPRRWLRAFPEGTDVRAEMSDELARLHEGRASLADVRPATNDEESAWLRGADPANPMCPTGALPRSASESEDNSRH